MRPNLLLLALAPALVACQSALPNQDPTGLAVPAVSGEDLDGTARSLPSQEPQILLVGYAQNAQFDIDRWILGLSQAGTPLPITEVPTIPGLAPGMIAGTIDQGMRDGIPPQDWAAVVTIYGDDAADLAAFTGTELPNNARVLLLDAAGRVAWFHDRGYGASLVLELDAAARDLAGLDPRDPLAPLLEASMDTAEPADTAADDGVLFDFTTDGREGDWFAMDDRVMGGKSVSSLAVEPRTGAFAGDLVLDGGGFASVRTQVDLDLSEATALELLVRGDGRAYQVRLGDDGRWDGVRWTHTFRPRAGEWTTVRIPMEDFRPTWRGRLVRNAGELNAGSITDVGLLLSDGGDGPFRLDVRWIRAMTD